MDRAPEVARFLAEMPLWRKLLIALGPARMAGDEIVRRFPGLTVDEFRRGTAIAGELRAADRAARRV